MTPQTVAAGSGGDLASARLLRRLLSEEIGHVAIGVRWFESGTVGQEEPAALWQNPINENFRGALKGPFNVSARDAAGLTKLTAINVAEQPSGEQTVPGRRGKCFPGLA